MDATLSFIVPPPISVIPKFAPEIALESSRVLPVPMFQNSLPASETGAAIVSVPEESADVFTPPEPRVSVLVPVML